MNEASRWVVFAPRGRAEVHRQLRELEARGGRVLRLDSGDLMDLMITVGDGFVAAALNQEVWH